jgi:hypothetical protein
MAFHRDKFFVKQAAIAAPDAYNLQFVKYGSAHHSAYSGIHAGGVAARRQNPDFFDWFHLKK